MTQTPPRWDLSNVYPSLESAEFNTAIAQQVAQIEALEQIFHLQIPSMDIHTPVAQLSIFAGDLIDRFNQAFKLAGTIRPYIHSFVSTDSRNLLARKKLSEYEQISVRLHKLTTQFQAWNGRISPVLEQVIAASPVAAEHAFGLREAAEQSRYLMSESEESLAAELSLSGAGAWGKLQGTLTSQLTAEIEVEGEVKKLPLPAVINLHSHPDEGVRQRAYETELKMLASVQESLAACLNGVKGAVNTLDQRRGREDCLHSAIDDARIDRATLEAMLAAMQASFPSFRKYFKAKARRLGKEKLAWWDMFAPLGKSEKEYSFQEARNFILEKFSDFSPDLEALARRAFDNFWIDAEQREGKRGGAFCMGLAGVQESRVLCNFDGTLDQVSTIAHELGHAFHNDCAYRENKTPLQQNTPMTMAETASIMCQTIIMQAILTQVNDPKEELAILETTLIDDAQVIVDIYSRYLFEKEVFERRSQAELSVDDFCEIMVRAQKATYGDGLDENFLNPYMWAWKPHYYREGLSFYNFPYSFGLLFGIGLFAIYQQRGQSFVPEYQKLLASTGEDTAANLAARFGIDIRSRKFWEDSLAVIAQRIERYCEIE
jgi:pepF/M3 family oligoendopeptidase